MSPRIDLNVKSVGKKTTEQITYGVMSFFGFNSTIVFSSVNADTDWTSIRRRQSAFIRDIDTNISHLHYSFLRRTSDIDYRPHT